MLRAIRRWRSGLLRCPLENTIQNRSENQAVLIPQIVLALNENPNRKDSLYIPSTTDHYFLLLNIPVTFS